MTTTTDYDYLTEDSRVGGQSFVCLSFMEPGEKQRAEIIAEVQETVGADGTAATYIDEYDRLNKPKRALKVRGSYNTHEIAKQRCADLIEEEPEVDVFVGQVGFWCQYNPCATKVGEAGEEKYSCDDKSNEVVLNKMIGEYKRNRKTSEREFEKRKREMVEKAIYEGSPEGQAEMAARKEPIEAVEFSLETAQKTRLELEEKLARTAVSEKAIGEKLAKMRLDIEQGIEYPQIGDNTSLVVPPSFDAQNVLDNMDSNVDRVREIEESRVAISKQAQSKQAQ